MNFYANTDGSPISQKKINTRQATAIPLKKVNSIYNICDTVFDYEPGNNLPPCPHFLDNFLTSRVFVFSLPFEHNDLACVPGNEILKQYCSEFLGYPKTAIKDNFEIGWVGTEKNDDTMFISNIQLNGVYKGYTQKAKHKQIYRHMIRVVLDEIKHRPIYIPTAKTLKTLTNRFSDHPERAIMETPYTGAIQKGLPKIKFVGKVYANKYLHSNELEVFVKE